MIRVRAYVDGYNLYHAIKRLRDPHLKWVDLWKLVDRFVPNRTAQLVGVDYFSAYATWLPPQMARHKAYVAALEVQGVRPIMSSFKEKDRRCPSCGHGYKGHEEKETDVRIALAILNDARLDLYDRAVIVSRDSDIVPAAELVKAAFPEKEVYALAPPSLGHSNEMLRLCNGKQKIKRKHVEESLLPAQLVDRAGNPIARPVEYDPP